LDSPPAALFKNSVVILLFGDVTLVPKDNNVLLCVVDCGVERRKKRWGEDRGKGGVVRGKSDELGGRGGNEKMGDGRKRW
jgi:hypothetical protein